MTERAHSRIGASSLYRWGNCPGSVKASEGMPNRTSEFAAEGTVAHMVAEAMLRRELLDTAHPVPAVGTVVKCEGFDIKVTQEMLDHLRVYVDAVKAEADKPGATLWIECKFDLSSIHPDMFGTADAVVHSPRERKLYVFDLKYGQGLAVEVEDNEQLQFYAVGALLKTGATVDDVEIAIVQPRASHPDGADRRWPTTPLDLVEFTGDLAAKAKATEADDAPLNPGDWCRFCPFAALCPKLDDAARQIALQEFEPKELRGIPQYDPDELTRRLRQLPMLEAYAKRLREFAFFETMAGRGSPEFKLVEKRSNREWREPRVVADWLMLEFGLSEDEVYVPAEPKLRSPADVEKLLKGIPKAERDGFDRLWKKESSGVTLVPIEDRRAPVRRDALSEFSAVTTSTE